MAQVEERVLARPRLGPWRRRRRATLRKEEKREKRKEKRKEKVKEKDEEEEELWALEELFDQAREQLQCRT